MTARSRRPPSPPAVKAVEGTYVDCSEIQGRGLFAARAWARGAKIGEFEGSPVKRDGAHVLWVENPDGSLVGIRGDNAFRFLNHSARPNAEFDGTEVRAVRPIAPDDEITVHYGEDWDEVE